VYETTELTVAPVVVFVLIIVPLTTSCKVPTSGDPNGAFAFKVKLPIPEAV
jgi:hypothetical protein